MMEASVVECICHVIYRTTATVNKNIFESLASANGELRKPRITGKFGSGLLEGEQFEDEEGFVPMPPSACGVKVLAVLLTPSELNLDTALYVTPNTRVAAVEQVSVPAGRAGQGVVWARRYPGESPMLI
jgi:hypothetical protein